MIEWERGKCPRANRFMASTFFTSRMLPRAARKLTDRALRIVVALSLWHAPIPWVHVHELKGPQVEKLTSLSQHVADFHARDLNWGRGSSDWHAHLVLPWCLNHQHRCPADDDRNSSADDIFSGVTVVSGSAAAGSAFGQPTNRAFLASVIPADAAAIVNRDAGTSAALLGQAFCRHFFETYGCSVAIRDLVSVRVC